MPLLLNVALERVELTTPGEWVDLKSRLSKGDQTRIQSAAFKVQAAMAAGRAGDMDVAIDYEASVFAGLEVGIVAWSFGEPVTPANIRALSAEDYDLVTERANGLWAPRRDDDRKNSFANGAPPPSTAAASLPTSSG